MKAFFQFCLAFLLLTGVGGAQPNPQGIEEFRDGAYVWRPSAISLSLHDGDHAGTKGQYIRLDQKLPDGEKAWTMSIMDLPDTWEIKNLGFQGLALRFENQLGETFLIQPPELNELDFAILSGGDKDDKILETLWRKHALEKK